MPLRSVADFRLRQLRREIESDIAREHAAGDELVFAHIEFSADRLVIGVEAPRDPAAVKTGFQFREHAAVAHALDALALVALGHIGADEGKRNAVELSREHRVDVVDQFARDRILVGGHADTQVRHRPLDRRPVQRRETARRCRACCDRACSRRRRENRRPGIVLLNQIFQPQQIGESGWKNRFAILERGPLFKHFAAGTLTRGAQPPSTISLCIFK